MHVVIANDHDDDDDVDDALWVHLLLVKLSQYLFVCLYSLM